MWWMSCSWSIWLRLHEEKCSSGPTLGDQEDFTVITEIFSICWCCLPPFLAITAPCFPSEQKADMRHCPAYQATFLDLTDFSSVTLKFYLTWKTPLWRILHIRLRWKREGSHFMLLDLLSGLLPLSGELREDATKLTPQQASLVLDIHALVSNSIEIIGNSHNMVLLCWNRIVQNWSTRVALTFFPIMLHCNNNHHKLRPFRTLGSCDVLVGLVTNSKATTLKTVLKKTENRKETNILWYICIYTFAKI